MRKEVENNRTPSGVEIITQLNGQILGFLLLELVDEKERKNKWRRLEVMKTFVNGLTMPSYKNVLSEDQKKEVTSWLSVASRKKNVEFVEKILENVFRLDLDDETVIPLPPQQLLLGSGAEQTIDDQLGLIGMHSSYDEPAIPVLGWG